MALRKILGFDHLGIVNTRANFTKLVQEMGINHYYSTGSDKAPVVAADGWITSSFTSQNNSLWFGFPSASFVKDEPTFSVFGCRFKFLSWGTPNLSGSILFISDLTGGITTLTHQLLSTQDIININGGTTNITNVEFVIETVLNWVSGLVEVYVNKEFIRTVNIANPNIVDLYNARNILVCVSGAGGTNTQRMSRDFYWLDNDPLEEPNLPLGNFRVAPVVATVEEANGWVASTGTVDSVLKTNILQATPDTPVVNTEGFSPIVSGMQIANLAADEGILGIEVYISSKKAPGTTKSVGISLSLDESESDMVVVNQTETMRHGVPAGLFAKAPTGEKWTRDIFFSTKLKLTAVE